MSRADFYLLKRADTRGRLQWAARLAEKAWRRGIAVVVLAQDKEQGLLLDRLLWQVREAAFVPHELWGADVEYLSPPVVLISWVGHPDPLPEMATESLLIPLAEQVDVITASFGRYAEIVTEDEAIKHSTRQRYRHYQQQGIVVHTHTLSD